MGKTQKKNKNVFTLFFGKNLILVSIIRNMKLTLVILQNKLNNECEWERHRKKNKNVFTLFFGKNLILVSIISIVVFKIYKYMYMVGAK